ncbi:alpha/beta fold hydrolase [Streptomyces yaizuensis]|uniref:Alpha/beta fold hydrolase n=1 Tax=Streptomyces yaizuensis TaxID=2989713 RepID=A0ABQ5PA84_9ACTN|nr:alpha/beta hydrolase [Streptomyces sp. YSPA8]GLF99141.1 alpha/beta fold hydrolase [Streptomyces sp. YSPA8]
MGDGSLFFERYEAVLARWPVPVESLDVPSRYGSTRVHVCGPPDAPPVVLLPGGGTTSVVWYANAGELARDHRVYAVDLMGDIGRSLHNGAPLRGPDDLMAWLDLLVRELDLAGADLCGHSYGAWIALRYALHAPDRIGRLALLDPVACFGEPGPRYVLRALPVLLRRTPERVRGLHEWESGGPAGDPVWRAFLESTGTVRPSKVVTMRRPKAAELRSCSVPTLVALAGESRAHAVGRVAATARTLMPAARVVTLPGASHHSLPQERPAELNRVLTEFLAPAP